MDVNSKTFRLVSVSYFVFHIVHLIVMIASSFLPYSDGKNAYAIFVTNWQFLIVGFVLLAVGCFCAWRTIKGRPYYCIPALVLTLLWELIQFFFAGLIGLAYVFKRWANQSDVSLGIGMDILPYGMVLLLVADAAYLIYMGVLLFVTPKSRLHK